MRINKLQELKIGELRARIPIIQGGMGVGISLAGLAAAVANEGGIGVIAAAGIGMTESDFFSNYLGSNVRAIRNQIREAREHTKGILGVNIMVALSNYADMVKTSVSEGIDIIFSGGGLPLDLPQLLNGNVKTKLVPIVSSGRAARIICKRWSERHNRLPDAIVVEGPMAGGHLGFRPEDIDDAGHTLENLVPEVISEIKPFIAKHGIDIPVIAAGGVYTGEDIARFIHLGAAGVQLGTRFVTTHECNASNEFKQAYIDSAEEDIVVINSPVGMPGRAIRNKFLDDVSEGKKKPYKCPYHCIRTCDYEESPYCIFFALVNAQRGLLKHGFAFAGSNAWRATEIISVHELMTSLIREYETAEAASAESEAAGTADKSEAEDAGPARLTG
ncbi:MAG: nitronate monooxygenase family protein [Actinobacteria bacterium]|nr:nitronate monooxygenase family protein [Actinomycetota bacterium]